MADATKVALPVAQSGAATSRPCVIRKSYLVSCTPRAPQKEGAAKYCPSQHLYDPVMMRRALRSTRSGRPVGCLGLRWLAKRSCPRVETVLPGPGRQEVCGCHSISLHGHGGWRHLALVAAGGHDARSRWEPLWFQLSFGRLRWDLGRY